MSFITLKRNNGETTFYKRNMRKPTNFMKNNRINVSLLKKAKKEYYQNLDNKNVIDNKKCWEPKFA